MRADFGCAEARHRLVEQQQLRPGGERNREFELALFAVAQLRDHDVGAMLEPDPVERRLRRLAERFFLAGIAQEAKRVTVAGLRRQRDIVGRGEVRQQRGDLEGARQPELAALPGRQMGDVLAGKTDGAGARAQLSDQLADQRGLAGAVRPDDRVQFAARDIEREIVGRDDAAEPPDQIFDAKQRFSHGRTSRPAP